MNTQPHNALSAINARRKICEGQLTSVNLIKACLTRIEESDNQIKAWAQLDAELALLRAEEMDNVRRSGKAVGPLHGVPVALKDIIDTQGLPTERGTPVFAGRRPSADAAVVERLLDAGAVVLGKTVTTEFAFMHPSATRNPHNVSRTPGGSSSGSAAAVAAFQVPLAIGTQTNGSVIRPASFCGTFGFKPTRGVTSRRGILQTSQSLDQVGVFARTLEDAALLADVISAYDPIDSASFARPRPAMLEGCRADVPVTPNFAVHDLPYDDRTDEDARAGLDELISALGGQVERLPSPEGFPDLIHAQRVIHEYEFCRHLGEVFAANWDALSASIKPAVERGRAISAAQYEDAVDLMNRAGSYFDAFFKDFDAIITLGSSGTAPKIESGGTGDPVYCTIWTLCGLPCLALPLLVGENDLPIGVQLVGAAEEDDRLFRTASWMLKKLQGDAI